MFKSALLKSMLSESFTLTKCIASWSSKSGSPESPYVAKYCTANLRLSIALSILSIWLEKSLNDIYLTFSNCSCVNLGIL